MLLTLYQRQFSPQFSEISPILDVDKGFLWMSNFEPVLTKSLNQGMILEIGFSYKFIDSLKQTNKKTIEPWNG